MPNLSPVPVAPSAPPGPSASANHGPGDTPATNFMDVLTDHQARTDLPEGQADGDDTPQATSEQQPPAGDPVGPVAEGDQAPDAATANAEALAAALNAVPVPTVRVVVSVADTPAAAASATGSAVPAAPGAVVAALAQTDIVAGGQAPAARRVDGGQVASATPVEAAPAEATPAQAAPAQA